MLLSVEAVGFYVDIAGVALMLIGLVAATVRYGLAFRAGRNDLYSGYRRDIGRAILLGLEVLVAGDIIRTVAANPTLMGIAVLGGIVLIRTVLSFSLQVEIEGRWPWQSAGGPVRPRTGEQQQR